jgi:epsilon-lactone hydrolase
MKFPGKIVISMIFVLAMIFQSQSFSQEQVKTSVHAEEPFYYVPDHISKPMQEYTKTARPFPIGNMKTIQDWQDFRNKSNSSAKERIDKIRSAWGYESKPSKIAGIPVVWITPKEFVPENEDKLLIYLHPGGYVFGSANDTRQPASLARRLKIKAVSIDYRLAPESPYPAALEDTLAVYKELLKQYNPNKIVLTGFSSGGGLALAATLKARDINLSMPAAIGVFTPWTDVNKIGDTYYTLEGISPVVHYEKNTRVCMEAYVGSHDSKSPYISPVYGSYSERFPPVMIITGTRDMFLSNCVRLQEALLRADQHAELIVFEAMGHIFSMFYGTPEAEEATQYMAEFLSTHLK